MIKGGYKKDYVYSPNTHWTAKLKKLIEDTGFHGSWKDAIKYLWNSQTTKLIRRQRSVKGKKYNVDKPEFGYDLYNVLVKKTNDPEVEIYRKYILDILKKELRSNKK